MGPPGQQTSPGGQLSGPSHPDVVPPKHDPPRCRRKTCQISITQVAARLARSGGGVRPAAKARDRYGACRPRDRESDVCVYAVEMASELGARPVRLRRQQRRGSGACHRVLPSRRREVEVTALASREAARLSHRSTDGLDWMLRLPAAYSVSRSRNPGPPAESLRPRCRAAAAWSAAPDHRSRCSP
jgi:hypothetical protein